MAKKFSKNIPEKWITDPEDEEVQFLITPFSYTYLKVMPTEETLAPHVMLEIFVNSVKDWKGILDLENKPMKCNEKNKEAVALQDNIILSWVVSEIFKLSNIGVVGEEEAKN